MKLEKRALHFPQYHHLIVIGLCFLCFFLTTLVSDRVFEHLPHLEDELAYIWQARALATGHTVLNLPEPVRPFWQPFVVDQGGKRFGKYSLGWPLILSIGVWLGQLWVVNAFIASLSVALIYRLASEIFNPDTGLIAAVLVTFSPMALLLNATLMSHTSALFTTMLFLYAYWRLERGKRKLQWGLIAGFALGMTLINRPLAGVALGGPFIAWSGIRLIRNISSNMHAPAATNEPLPAPVVTAAGGEDLPTLPGIPAQVALPFTTRLVTAIKGLSFRSMLVPLLALSVVTGLLMLIIPAYNYAASGSTSQNLYLLVWNYDRVGFGPGYGAHGHNIEKGIRQTRWDFSLTAADTFGWETGFINDKDVVHLLNAGDYWDHIGLSWVLLPFGLLLGFKRRWFWWAIWLAIGAGIFMWTTNMPTNLIEDPTFSYLWMAGGAIWVLIPFAFFLRGKVDDQVAWTWLLFAICVSLVGLHLAYWIGSQRYSTRYYYEALGAFAILSAIPLAWLAKRWRFAVYAGLAIVTIYGYFTYSVPRIDTLYRFNYVSPQLIDAVNARRDGSGRPVLVIISGTDVKWRAYGSLMASTYPNLDSDIVAAWDYGDPGLQDKLAQMFPGRQVIHMVAEGNLGCFDNLQGECYGAAG